MGTRVTLILFLYNSFSEQRDTLGWVIAGLTFANIAVNQLSAILSMLKSLRDLFIKVRNRCRESKKTQIDVKIDYPDVFKPEGVSQTRLE